MVRFRLFTTGKRKGKREKLSILIAFIVGNIITKRHYIPSTIVPDTHVRSFGQPTYLTHPNIIKKTEGKE